MSEILDPQQRRAALAREQRRTGGLDAFGKFCGFVLGIVAMVLLVAGLGGVVAWIWRAAVR